MDATTDHDPLLRPAAPEERTVALDIVRGFALLGILIANLPIFSYFYSLYEPLSFPGLTPTGRAAEWVVRVFAEGSFYPLFSFLFGLGFALQLRKGDAVIPIYRRRLLVLLGIGLTHAIFVWYGDILVSYALLGLVLIAFRKRRDRTLLVWATVGLLYTFVFFALTGVGETQTALPVELTTAVEHTFQAGSYLEVVTIHLGWLALNLLNIVFIGPQILAFFLFGLLVGRRGLLDNLGGYQPLFRKALLLALVLALPTAAQAVALWLDTPYLLYLLLGAYDLSIGSPALGFAYLSGLLLLLDRSVWQRRLQPLAAVGRMALSNYLAQSLICVLIFYPYGLGLFGRLGPAWGLLLSAVIYSVQTGLSNLWLAHFRFGPAEWLWRLLTYRTRDL